VSYDLRIKKHIEKERHEGKESPDEHSRKMKLCSHMSCAECAVAITLCIKVPKLAGEIDMPV
jgi:hypothetical protein